MRCHSLAPVCAILTTTAFGFNNTTLALNSTSVSISLSNASEFSSATSSPSHGVAFYINQALDSSESTTATASFSSTLVISKVIVTTSTVLTTSKFSNSTSAGTPSISISSSLGNSSLSAFNTTTLRSTTTYPASWTSICPQLSLAAYQAPEVHGQLGSPEYISSCEAARRTYTSSLNDFNASIQSTWLSGSVSLYTLTGFYGFQPKSTTPPGIYTLCDEFPRLNTTSYNNYNIINTTTTGAWPVYQTITEHYPSCVFESTVSPTFPSPPDCTIPSAACTDMWSTWARTGNLLELTTSLGPPYTGTINTPPCATSEIPWFTCSEVASKRGGGQVSCDYSPPGCFIRGGTVQIHYWPPTTRNGGLCVANATTITPTAVQSATVTMASGQIVVVTSPTIYVSYDSIEAFLATPQSDFPNSPWPTYSTYYNVEYTKDQALVSTLEFRQNDFQGSPLEEAQYMFDPEHRNDFNRSLVSKRFNFADLEGPIPAATYWFGAGAQGLQAKAWVTWATHHQSWQAVPIGSTIVDDYAALLAMPSELLTLDPAWASCRTTVAGAWDPPIALTAASSADVVTVPSAIVHTTTAMPLQSVAVGPTVTVAPSSPTLVVTEGKAMATGSFSSVADTVAMSGASQAAESAIPPGSQNPQENDTTQVAQSQQTGAGRVGTVQTGNGVSAQTPTTPDVQISVSVVDSNSVSSPEETPSPAGANAPMNEKVSSGQTQQTINGQPTVNVPSTNNPFAPSPATTAIAIPSLSNSITLAQSGSIVVANIDTSTTTLLPGDEVTLAGQTIGLASFGGHIAVGSSTVILAQSSAAASSSVNTSPLQFATVAQQGSSLVFAAGSSTVTVAPGAATVLGPVPISAPSAGGSVFVGTDAVPLGSESHPVTLAIGVSTHDPAIDAQWMTLTQDGTATTFSNGLSIVSGNLVVGSSTIRFPTLAPSGPASLYAVATLTVGSMQIQASRIVTTNSVGSTVTAYAIEQTTSWSDQSRTSSGVTSFATHSEGSSNSRPLSASTSAVSSSSTSSQPSSSTSTSSSSQTSAATPTHGDRIVESASPSHTSKSAGSREHGMLFSAFSAVLGSIVALVALL